MTTKAKFSAIDRRQFLTTTAAAALLASVSAPRVSFAADKVVKIGFLAPLTGAVAAWGKPGLDGCQIWADRVNSAGGIQIGDDAYKVEFVAYDEEYDPGKARTGAVKLIKEDGVKFIMMLGGDPWPGVSPVAAKEKMLVSTLLPSDLTPETTMLVAPCEVHPIYNVTGVEWLAENKPDAKTAVICAQDDSLGKPSVATYLAAFEAAGIKVLGDPIFFDPATTDFAPIMSKMLALKPDIICLDTCYADYVHPLTEQAFQQGFKGQLISCTADFYGKMIDKTSKEFMEGFIFQFPDFDDLSSTSRRSISTTRTASTRSTRSGSARANGAPCRGNTLPSWTCGRARRMRPAAWSRSRCSLPCSRAARASIFLARRTGGAKTCSASTTRWSVTGLWSSSRTAKRRSRTTGPSQTGGTRTRT